MTDEQRFKLITKLIDLHLEVNAGDGEWFVRDLMRQGWRGYDDYTDEELITEAEENSIDINGL